MTPSQQGAMANAALQRRFLAACANLIGITALSAAFTGTVSVADVT
jgi:hypothetical protein